MQRSSNDTNTPAGGINSRHTCHYLSGHSAGLYTRLKLLPNSLQPEFILKWTLSVEWVFFFFSGNENHPLSNSWGGKKNRTEMFTPTGEEWNDNARDGLMPGIRVDTIKELLRLNGRWRTIRSETFFFLKHESPSTPLRCSGFQGALH